MSNRPNHFLSLQSATPAAAPSVALCAAVALPETDAAPEWIHVLPAGHVTTVDGRGPYHVTDAARLISASLQRADRLVLDENHATDLAAPKGEPAPARGWIVALQARADGVWGKVEWTKAGAELMADRAYRHISPAILHDAANNVTAILRASLVNRPNLKGLTALHTEQTPESSMDIKKLAAALGLPETATEAEIVAALAARNPTATALQSLLDPIAVAAGLATGADAAAVLAGVQKLGAGGGDKSDGGEADGKVIVALQAELAGVTTQLTALLASTKQEKATAFVDDAIKAGRVGIKPMRDRYIALHVENPARTEEIVNAMPILGGGSLMIPAVTQAADGEIALNAEQRHAAKLLGLSEKDYAATLKAEREIAL